MALRTRCDYYGLTTGIKTERLYPISRMVSTITGLAVQRNKAIVGRNAFAHEAGIHQDGMLKERSTYEIMRPEDVGRAPDRPRPGQALRPPRPARPRDRAGLSRSTTSSSRRSSTTSRPWPTRRRKSTTKT